MTAVDSRLPRLPACHICYTKKVKCDNNRPTCAPCVRSGSECITLGLDGHQPVSRGYIHDLEQRVRALQSELRNAIEDLPDDGTDDGPGKKKRRRNSTWSTYSSPSFTEGAGISFMRPLFTDPGWRAHDPSLLQNLSRSARLSEATVTPNLLPSAETARILFDNYLNGSHVLNPFLLRCDVEDLYRRVFLTDNGVAHSHHDLFRSFMILAIGSIHSFRRGSHPWHPYGYFLSAMQHSKSDILSRGIRSIQDLLLVGRFGIYHHIGTSIWEITQLCMRLCIEQGLHKPPTGHRTLVQEQLERRVFWACYVIDRYSSITLDRPLAIADRDIHVLLPVDANDEQLEAAEGTIADLNLFQISPNSRVSTDLTIFFHSVRHRQITSKIHALFQVKEPSSGVPSVTATGRIYAGLYRLLQELDDWRHSVPVFDNPRCVYETQDWCDLRWMRERLIVVRKAMDLVPKRSNVPPRDVLNLCLQNATDIIIIFCRLYESQQITYTRSYFQTLFTAGLSVVFCLSVLTDPDAGALDQAVDALGQCELSLRKLGQDLPDASHYVAVYEALYRHTVQKLRQSGRWPGVRTSQADQSQLAMANIDNTVQDALSHTQLLYSTDLGDWPLPTPNSLPTGTDAPTVDTNTLPDELLSFGAPFWDDTMWNMEVGLGEYAYGNPHGLSLWDDASFPL
ncbi:fungal-specific transcription factor domain-containing protein [Aspergillus karnatakaensis]|uniref:Zn(II)2Cys6 transcription factor domain-containing protein n=1 Tax=Aspergillus karnatakaensis TaxID=1810916 RepID=UPI003CCCD81E